MEILDCALEVFEGIIWQVEWKASLRGVFIRAQFIFYDQRSKITVRYVLPLLCGDKCCSLLLGLCAQFCDSDVICCSCPAQEVPH
jgi:hypothetical protein